jgi:hypothetical protein
MAEDDQSPETEELKDWLVEDFPVALRFRLKTAVGHRRTTIKSFVRNTIEEAVEKVETEMLSLANEGRQRSVRRSSPRDAGLAPTKNHENKGSKKGKKT